MHASSFCRRILYESVGKSALDKSVVQFDQVTRSDPFRRLVICLQKNSKFNVLLKLYLCTNTLILLYRCMGFHCIKLLIKLSSVQFSL